VKGNKMVAQEILRQLGGNRFIAMTGAKNCADVGNGLAFQLPSKFANQGINAVKIVLDPSDTYTVKFMRFWGTNLKTISEHHDVYCDQLVELFETQTGLYTHL
jgi:hypothetical protein